MIGIGHKLEKQTRIKILGEQAREHNQKYDNLVEQGMHPDEAAKTLAQDQMMKRTALISANDNRGLGGALHLGYLDTHKTLTSTQNQFATSGIQRNLGKTTQQVEDHNKMKARIQQDHLKQDAQIDFGEPIQSDYKRNFKDDEKMKQIRPKMDKQFNQRKNDLKEYAQTYIKTKDSLRKC